MSPLLQVVGTTFVVQQAVQHISRRVEMRKGKKVFLQSKNFLLMRYNNVFKEELLVSPYEHEACFRLDQKPPIVVLPLLQP
jgi:hypothetical protein